MVLYIGNLKLKVYKGQKSPWNWAPPTPWCQNDRSNISLLKTFLVHSTAKCVYAT